ncbi:SEFIR domain-containing protein [Microbulbifer sp. SSSA005]|uniref:SEFIR domain-containing protein n=1 Tax=Microbulbifer sp. SSSA005 TaxID=3243378 RepID=UPI00403941BF
MESPKVFVSYSWSTPEHEEWVLNLSTELRESGVDIILDKWDLKEGHDSNAFMERMVTDSSVKKVIIVCDESYANKADKRSGGVGTETQIISSEIYSSVDQDKFVAVIAEKDADGSAHLPTYYKSRIYIDLSYDELYAKKAI